MDLTTGDYICINTLAGFNQIKKYLGNDKVKPVYIEVSDIELIKRAVKREEKQINPNVADLCRRFSEIDIKSRFQNDELEVCVDKITAYIKEN